MPQDAQVLQTEMRYKQSNVRMALCGSHSGQAAPPQRIHMLSEETEALSSSKLTRA